ncbi:MAG: CHAD domain-containing protein [Wenzhouxiangella sp.]|jgi:CHAD domain-containing protein|nr:CHAD domain-containing protein [Wenzhouxiangella sp.]
MSFRIERTESVQAAIQRIATEQIDKAIAEIDSDEVDRHETVHQVRKRCKKLRALVRLVRPVFPDYGEVNGFYRDAARELSAFRDAQAVIETFDDLIERFDSVLDGERFASIRSGLVSRRERIDADGERIDRLIAAFREEMVAGRAAVASWKLDADEGSAVAGGTRKTFKRARKAMAKAATTPTTAAFHEWRKRVKYHWYHARLLTRCWPELIEPWAQEAKRLSDLLGDEHDLAVLHGLLLDDPDRFADETTLQAFFGLIERRRAKLRTQAFRLGRFVLFERPSHIERRVRSYVDTWKSSAGDPGAPAPMDVER